QHNHAAASPPAPGQQQAAPAQPQPAAAPATPQQNAAATRSVQAPAAGPTPAATAAVEGDATAGRLVYSKCRACHSLDPGKNLVGPSLANIIGRKAGSEANYNY